MLQTTASNTSELFITELWALTEDNNKRQWQQEAVGVTGIQEGGLPTAHDTHVTEFGFQNARHEEINGISLRQPSNLTPSFAGNLNICANSALSSSAIKTPPSIILPNAITFSFLMDCIARRAKYMFLYFVLKYIQRNTRKKEIYGDKTGLSVNVDSTPTLLHAVSNWISTFYVNSLVALFQNDFM